jgi:hypothetical protein
MTARQFAACALVALLAACGGSPPPSETGFAASTDSVAVSGRVAEAGTRGSILVFAYADLAASDDPAEHEPASVGTLAADGGFDLTVPPCASLTVVFLVDRSHDGVVDRGDSTAAYSSPDLTDLQPGDRVNLADVAIDFAGHRVTATVEVSRATEPAHTPTPIPAT